MRSSGGYVQLRRGLFDHVRDGRLSFFEASLYTAIISDASPSTGVCFGSAGLYSALYSVSARTCRDALEKLETKGYLKRFTTRGKHGSYPMVVNKFLCSDGAMKGMYVNAAATTDYDKVAYVSRDDGVEESVEESVNDGVNESAASKRREKRDKKQKPSAKAEPSPDPRASDFKADFEKAFEFINHTPAPWDAKESTNLKRWLAKNPTITRSDWQNILQNRRKSPGINQAADLSRWIGCALAWMDGTADDWGKPIKTNGGSNGFTANTVGNTNLAVLTRAVNARREGDCEDGDVSQGDSGRFDFKALLGPARKRAH